MPDRPHETSWEKAVRKVKAEPLVPLGAFLTAGVLIAGFRSLLEGNRQKSQILMRYRVAAQAFTFVMILTGSSYGFGAKKHENYEEKFREDVKSQMNIKDEEIK